MGVFPSLVMEEIFDHDDNPVIGNDQVAKGNGLPGKEN